MDIEEFYTAAENPCAHDIRGLYARGDPSAGERGLGPVVRFILRSVSPVRVRPS